MNPTEFLSVIQEQFPPEVRESIKMHTILRSIKGWSSLQALVITVAIDESYGILISDQDLRNVSSIQDLYQIILTKSSNTNPES